MRALPTLAIVMHLRGVVAIAEAVALGAPPNVNDPHPAHRRNANRAQTAEV